MTTAIDANEGRILLIDQPAQIGRCGMCKGEYRIKVWVPVCDHNLDGLGPVDHADYGEGEDTCADGCHPAEIELYEFYRLNGTGAEPGDQIVRCAGCENIIE